MHEPSSIEQLFNAHHQRLLRLATIMLRNEEEAADTVAEVFSRWAEHASPPDPSQLTASVRNRCIDRIRHMKMADRVRRRLPLEEPYDSPWEQEDKHEERMKAVQEAIDTRLTTPMRRTLMLRYYEEKSYREIAQTLDISETAVYKHLRNALERLRQHLKP